MRQEQQGETAEAIGRNAAVVVFEQGQIRTLREGTNNFTCLPDNPQTPGITAACFDENGLEWVKARRAGKEPPAGQVGFSYMLGGEDWTASNVDPAATEPPPGEDWVKSGPHVMILNPGDLAQGYPNPGKDPDTSQA